MLGEINLPYFIRPLSSRGKIWIGLVSGLIHSTTLWTISKRPTHFSLTLYESQEDSHTVLKRITLVWFLYSVRFYLFWHSIAVASCFYKWLLLSLYHYTGVFLYLILTEYPLSFSSKRGPLWGAANQAFLWPHRTAAACALHVVICSSNPWCTVM